ncbi:kinase-like domain-containing protein, partial [Gaertneriomyces semiglobifer]
YRLLGKLGEGTFSEVLKVRNRKTGKVYAMKRFRKHFKSSAEIENLREIQALRRVAPHPNIIELHEVIFEPTTGTLSLTFDLMLMNLYEYISQRPSTAGTRSAPDGLSESLIKHFTSHLLTALEHIHNRGIFHRDIKPENILLTPFIPPALPVLKLSDFGSCRGIHSKPPYTSYIATRWYRPPECLLGNGTYGAPMDIWGVGCVIFEMTKGQPLFPGGNEVDMLFRIHGVVGTPKGETVKKIVG